MLKEHLIINGIILFYIMQRIGELLIGKNNEEWLKKNLNAIEASPQDSLRMKSFHILWFLSLLIEANTAGKLQSPGMALLIYAVLVTCMMVRFHTMEKLKQFWTIKVFSMQPHELKTEGLYQFLRHPNYAVVIAELILIPLLFKAWVTLILFSILNFFILKKRIQLEEETLMAQTNYREAFAGKKRIIPYLFTILFLISRVNAEEIQKQFKSYEEAKSSPSFIKFESTSTKLGFITTSFDGYAREMKINYEEANNVITGLFVSIPVKSFDTNNSSRNEKMIKEIFDADHFPQVTVSTDEKIQLKEGEQTVEMVFHIREKTIKRPVVFNFKKHDGKFVVSGKSSINIKEAGLPSPDIPIARVRENFDISFAASL